jgi:hypothetical protein
MSVLLGDTNKMIGNIRSHWSLNPSPNPPSVWGESWVRSGPAEDGGRSFRECLLRGAIARSALVLAADLELDLGTSVPRNVRANVAGQPRRLIDWPKVSLVEYASNVDFLGTAGAPDGRLLGRANSPPMRMPFRPTKSVSSRA